MDATSSDHASLAARKHKTMNTLVRLVGGGVLAILHGFVVYEAGKFMFLEYIARLSDKYVWITPQPHVLLQAVVMIGIFGMLAAIAPLIWRSRLIRWLWLSFAFVIFEVPLPVVFSAQNEMYRAGGPLVG